VACLLSHADHFLLLRRSRRVGSDRGRWHCVTGFCEPGVDPLEQAVREVREETGMPLEDVHLLRRAPLRLEGQDGAWTVHAFHFACSSSRVVLNWENDDAVWLCDPGASGLSMVPWLDVVHRTLTDTRRPALCDVR
jgi:ADP-ribose pyrophosphatase YjhB (NUDIX family)